MACNNDAWIGPTVRGCRDDFDFTVTFELVCLTLIPASLFCITSFVRIWSLVQRPRVVQGSAIWSLKLVWSGPKLGVSLVLGQPDRNCGLMRWPTL